MVEVDGIYYTLDSSNYTAEVTSSYSEYRGDIVIPASISVYGATYSVTTIGNSAFNFCDGLTSIEIPNAVADIIVFGQIAGTSAAQSLHLK